jgi:hypothetical protein
LEQVHLLSPTNGSEGGVVPLSEEELRLLEQMERALVEEDPKFASTLRGTSLRRSARRKVVLAAVGLVAGIVVMMAGVVAGGSSSETGLTWIIVFGIVGFLLMLASATFGLAALRSQRHVAAPPTEAHPAAGGTPNFTLIHGSRRSRGPHRPHRPGGRTRSSGSFMERMEERWRRRREQGF